MKQFGRRSDDEPGANDATATSDAPPPPRLAALRLATDTEAGAVERLRTKVLSQIDPASALELSPFGLRRQLEGLVHSLAEEERVEITAQDQARLAEDLANDMLGLGPIERLLDDDTISDIMVNGPNNVYVERSGKLQRVALRFRDAAHIATIAQRLAAAVGRRIDESSPMVDARLPDGSRVNVIFPPLAIDSPCISIRKFARHRLDFSAMIANGTMTAQLARLLEIAARSRLNILVSGGTGSGKTTLLNALSRMIDHDERLVTIEDTAELLLQQPHVIRLETRPPNIEGRGEVTQRELVRNALRMRPDRIIVGEVRGVEAFDMLQAMNTGHDGSISTIHANTARDALTRIENMVQISSFGLPPTAIRHQIASALDLVVQLERMRDGVRRVVQVTEVHGMEGDVITTSDIAAFEFAGETGTGRIQGNYVMAGTRPGFLGRCEYFGLDRAWLDTMRGGIG